MVPHVEKAAVHGFHSAALETTVSTVCKNLRFHFAAARIFIVEAIAPRATAQVELHHGRGSKLRTIGELKMQWIAPAFEEVCLNCEINSYVSAKL